MIDQNETKGMLRNVGGKVQDAVGGLTGDTSTQFCGKVNEAAGQAQDIYGRVAGEVKDFASEQPMLAILAAAGFGMLIGIVIARR